MTEAAAVIPPPAQPAAQRRAVSESTLRVHTFCGNKFFPPSLGWRARRAGVGQLVELPGQGRPSHDPERSHGAAVRTVGAADRLRGRYAAGLRHARSERPRLWWLGDFSINGNEPTYSEIYESTRFKLPGTNFENQEVGAKILGYSGVGENNTGGTPTQVYSQMRGSGSSTAIGTAFPLDLKMQGPASATTAEHESGDADHGRLCGTSSKCT